MTFKEKLNHLIDESGLTLKEISEKCEVEGVQVSTNYLSVLRTQKDKYCSEQVAIAIAKACDAKYHEILVVHMGLEKSPQEIQNFVSKMYKQTFGSATSLLEQFKSLLPEETMKRALSTVDTIDEATFVCEFLRGMYDEEYEAFMSGVSTKKGQNNQKWALVPIVDNASIAIIDNDDVAKIVETKKNKK